MTDTAPNRLSLQNIEKKTTKKFREYAHKWRDLAAQVQPPMTDKELNKMFLNTLNAPYYDRMIENSNTNFSDMVFAGEMIESGVKLGKIERTEAKKLTSKKKKGETHTVSYQKKHITLLTRDSQTRAIYRTTNMPGVTHKGITSPMLGQWLVSLLCLHQYRW